MGKLTTLWQSIRVEYISLMSLDKGLLKIGGEVINSNFIEVGKRSIMPVAAEEMADKINIGDLVKVSLFTKKDNMEEEDEDDPMVTLTFEDCGARYEIWNTSTGGWDKIDEFFND